MKDIYDAIKEALVERGWGIDETAQENKYWELHEFIHPETGNKLVWIDAIHAQDERELDQEEARPVPRKSRRPHRPQ
jgi:hypothetical protein